MSPKKRRSWVETACEQSRQHIFDYQWGYLAQQIYRDLKETLNVAPNPMTAAKHEKVLNEYFDIMGRSDSRHWIPNEKYASSELAQE